MKYATWQKLESEAAAGIFLLLMLGLCLFVSGCAPTPARAEEGNLNRNVVNHQQMSTPTPGINPEDASPEVIREGRPVGIVVGAGVILAVILLSTTFSLSRIQRSERPQK